MSSKFNVNCLPCKKKAATVRTTGSEPVTWWILVTGSWRRPGDYQLSSGTSPWISQFFHWTFRYIPELSIELLTFLKIWFQVFLSTEDVDAPGNYGLLDHPVDNWPCGIISRQMYFKTRAWFYLCILWCELNFYYNNKDGCAITLATLVAIQTR
jgi:hypothetical protein